MRVRILVVGRGTDRRSPRRRDAATAKTVLTKLGPSRAVVHRLALLLSVDDAGGGLVTTGFLSYCMVERYGVSLSELGWLFFLVSITQALSVLVAPVLARRFGLVPTMVWTHLPSNLIMASRAFAPTFTVAALLLLLRTTMSQTDPPTRQAPDHDGHHVARADPGGGRDQRRTLLGTTARSPARGGCCNPSVSARPCGWRVP